MATLAATNLTLSDLKGRIDPSGQLDDIIELASNANHFIQDALMLEGNESAGDLGTVRTGLPAGTWRKLYAGVADEKSVTKQVLDSVGILESFSKVDAHLVEMAPDPAAFRAQEDASFLEGMMQTIETTFFDGDTGVDPEKFMGLQPRFNSLTGAETSNNVFDQGAAGSDNTSIWMVTWERQCLYTFYGKGTNAGFSMENLGKMRVEEGATGRHYMAFVTHFKWQLGLAVRDWRYAGRIANIDISLWLDGTDEIRIPLIKLLNRRPTTTKGNTVLYMNKDAVTALELEASKPQAGMSLQIKDYFGELIPFIRGVPVRTADSLTNSEALVT